jgi:RNA polymerase sigma factor (TIGR02999 family)
MSDVTQILLQIEQGDFTAAEQLLPLVYNELRKLAAQKLANERAGHTLEPTALVHEAFLRLVDSNVVQSWQNRGYFFAAAAEAMRRILVESARHKRSKKAGGDWRRVELAEVEPASPGSSVDLLMLDEALAKLEAQHARQAALVKLRFFAGLTQAQAADALRVSMSTADNDWAYAKSFLRLEMSGEGQNQAD